MIDKYLIEFKTWEQVSPEDFDVFRHQKIVDENTTIGDIYRWQRLKLKKSTSDVPFHPITITRPG